MLEYFDKDMKPDQKYYAWELAQTRQWRHFMDNPSACITFIRCVLEGVTKDIARQAARNTEEQGTRASEREGTGQRKTG